MRVLSPGRNERNRSLPDGSWTLPAKEWVFPDGDRLFPGGGPVFTGQEPGQRASRQATAAAASPLADTPSSWVKAGAAPCRPESVAPPAGARAGAAVPPAGVRAGAAGGAAGSSKAGAAARHVSAGATGQPMRLIRPASAGVSPRPVRLTQRGRIVVAILGVLVVAGLFVAAASAAQATSGSTSRPATGGAERVVVRPGDTLWSIAKSADPGADTRTVVQEMLQLNRIPGSSITPGQSLLVPRG